MPAAGLAGFFWEVSTFGFGAEETPVKQVGTTRPRRRSAFGVHCLGWVTARTHANSVSQTTVQLGDLSLSAENENCYYLFKGSVNNSKAAPILRQFKVQQCTLW